MAVLLTKINNKKREHISEESEFNFGSSQLAFLKGIQGKQDLGWGICFLKVVSMEMMLEAIEENEVCKKKCVEKREGKMKMKFWATHF